MVEEEEEVLRINKTIKKKRVVEVNEEQVSLSQISKSKLMKAIDLSGYVEMEMFREEIEEIRE